MGAEGIKCCPDSEEEQRLLGSQSTQAIRAGILTRHSKVFRLPVSHTGRIHWVYVKFFQQRKKESWGAKGETGAEPTGQQLQGMVKAAAQWDQRDHGDGGKLKQLN